MISFEVGKDKFNFRVSAIILDEKKERFLTNTREHIDFCVLPGGRVEMGEETPVSLKREFIEELGVEIEIVGLKAITENFFEFDNKNYHELQYLYVVKLLDKSIENNEGRFIGVEKKDIFPHYFQYFCLTISQHIDIAIRGNFYYQTQRSFR